MSEETKTQEKTQVDETTNQQEEEETKSEEQEEKEEPKTYLEDEVQKMMEEATTKLKREYSKKLGVNLFEDKEVEQFVEAQSNKVDKSKLEEYEKQVEDLNQYKSKYADLEFDFHIIKKGVPEDYAPKVKKLASTELEGEDMTTEKAIDRVIEEFPFFKKGGQKKVGMDVNQETTAKTAYEQYLDKNYIRNKNGKLVPKNPR